MVLPHHFFLNGPDDESQIRSDRKFTEVVGHSYADAEKESAP